MRLRYTAEALAHLEAIFDFLSNEIPLRPGGLPPIFARRRTAWREFPQMGRRARQRAAVNGSFADRRI